MPSRLQIWIGFILIGIDCVIGILTLTFIVTQFGPNYWQRIERKIYEDNGLNF